MADRRLNAMFSFIGLKKPVTDEHRRATLI
jgi:hypothetical protein